MVLSEEEIKGRLLEEKLVTPEQLKQAEEVQKKTDQPVLEVLVKLGFLSQSTASSFLSRQKEFPQVDLGKYEINPAAVSMLKEEIARRYLSLPIDFDGDRLVVAMAKPDDVVAIDDLRIVTGQDIDPVFSSENDIQAAISRCYKASEAEEEIEEVFEEEKEDEEVEEITEEAPVVKLVNLIITQAIRDRASDIHIEPQEKDLRVRYRVDGVLHEIMHTPKRIQQALISRFKITAGMDVAERRKPQDGHASLTVGGKAYDFRVATLPIVYGERVVIRILEKESILIELDDLGFLKQSLERFRGAFTKPYGAILVTGPTGSGKSTTLYATLNVLNTVGKNIVTVEDPVEYRLGGINQIQINPKAGLTFATGLRAILRTAPDIVMVGEIRDRETAQIAIEAALTGHLVLSTLHTNDAPSALTRLTEMGIPPFLTASAIDCIQAQRLARRLCRECKEAYKPSADLLKEIGFSSKELKGVTFYRPKGCKVCKGAGYKGRIGIYEVMPISERTERLVVERKTAEEIRRVAIEEGMRTLRQDGLEKAKLGITSLEEVIRVVV